MDYVFVFHVFPEFRYPSLFWLFLFSVLDVPTHGGFCVPTCSSRGRNSAWSFELLLLLLLLSRGPTSIRRGVRFLFAVFSCERLCKDLRGFRLSPRFGDLPSSYPRRPLLAAALFTRCEAGARDSQWRCSGDRAGPRRAEPERWRGGRLSSSGELLRPCIPGKWGRGCRPRGAEGPCG